MTEKDTGKKKANLNRYPSRIKVKQNIVLGDIHGNAQYLLYLLVSFGILQMTRDDYEQLIRIYKKKTDDLQPSDLMHFRERLRNIKVSNQIAILFLGDTLSDRGNNDFFSLCIFRHLSKNDVPFKILLANHDYEFLNCYESSSRKEKPQYQSKNIRKSQTRSMTNLQRLLDKKFSDKKKRSILSPRTINRWVEAHLLGKYQAIGYSLGENSIKIYSHAPIDIALIKAIAKQLDLPFKDKKVKQLAETIDNINAKVQDLMLNRNLCNQFISIGQKSCEMDPLTRLIWNRNYQILKRSPIHHGYQVEFIHGHDKKYPSEPHTLSLDQSLGKSSEKNKDEFQYALADNFGFFNGKKAIKAGSSYQTKPQPSDKYCS